MTAKILIVEDEMLVAMEMKDVVEDLGHTPVGIAPDAESALILAELNPDLALVDLHLRDGLTGCNVAERLIERGVAVVFVTANPRMVAHGIKGALGVMGKPVDETMIQAVISFFAAWRKGLSARPPAGLTLFA